MKNSDSKKTIISLNFIVNFYSLVVFLRIVAKGNWLNTLIEVSIVLFLVTKIITSIVRKPIVLRENFKLIFVNYLVIMVILMGVLFVRHSVEPKQIFKNTRHIVTPLLISLFIILNKNEFTEKYKVKSIIPNISIAIALGMGHIQLFSPRIIQEFYAGNIDYVNLSRSTNFIRGSIHNRLIGVFNDPNLYGLFLGINILFMLFDLNESKEKKFKSVIILSMAVQLILTTSRTAIFTTFTSIILLLILKRRKTSLTNLLKKSSRLMLLLVSVVFLIKLSAYIGLSLDKLIMTRFKITGTSQLLTFNNRSTDWMFYIKLFSNNVLFTLLGVGDSAYIYTFDAIENTFISIILKHGIAMLFLLVIYYLILIRSARIKKSQKVSLSFFIILSSTVADIDTLLFITVPVFSYLSLHYSIKNIGGVL